MQDGNPLYQEYLTWLRQNNEVDITNVPVAIVTQTRYGSSTVLSSSTSNKERSKLLLTTHLPKGFYKIEWTFSWSYSSVSTNFNAVLYVDNVPLHTFTQEPQDASSKQMNCVSSFLCVDLEEGEHEVDLRWFAGSSGATANISQAHILISEASK